MKDMRSLLDATHPLANQAAKNHRSQASAMGSAAKLLDQTSFKDDQNKQQQEPHSADQPQQSPEQQLLQELLEQKQAQQQRPLTKVSARRRSHSRVAAFLQLEETMRDDSSTDLGLLGLLELPAPARYCVYTSRAVEL